MSAKKRKGSFKNNPNLPKTRKQLRKEARKSKKMRRQEYYTNRKKSDQFAINEKQELVKSNKVEHTDVKTNNKAKIHKIPDKTESEVIREREKRQQKKLQQEMNKQRNKQLLDANLEEDRNIKRLEKQLKLNKRKSKSVPASFAQDGLDYLLEVCDSENIKSSALAEQQLTEVNDEFEEDLALMTENADDPEDSDNSINDDETHETLSSCDDYDESIEVRGEKQTSVSRKRANEEDEEDLSSSKKKRSKVDDSDDQSDAFSSDTNEEYNDNDDDDNDEDNYTSDKEHQKNEDGTWEDIYGRLRAEDGSIIKENNQKYLPPAARKAMEGSQSDKKLERLKKQLKGFINRLAESNMHYICTQIEELYMNNSRNDMNNTITDLIIEALVTNIIAPERLLMEHVLFITILHANVGTEVGAHFLQTIATFFNEYSRNKIIENKKLDNVIVILAQLYNFKLFDSKLIFEILNKLSDDFTEKDVECILHILRNVGFNLRKDNPLALKEFILNIQKKATSVSDELKNNSRVKFMLDVLLAIKNNNVSKIPNYDTTYSEHLKKIMKGFIRKGHYVTQLNISLEDLLKAEEKGRWWVVGSAWSGNTLEKTEIGNKDKEESNSFSQNLLKLARKQRMNTDTRKNIFCIIMSSEDYLDAFEKLLRLSLKNQQEREIIHVILHCCLQEKKYNPFYAVLAQKFCEHDRKYQMTIKYSVWDKLKTFKEHSANQISNLAKFLSYLFMEKGLSISILKIMQFSELDKVTLRFVRQILLRILLHEDLEVCQGVFGKISQSHALKMFRESLRLFMHHFLLRNLNSQDVSDDKKQLLQERVKIVEKLLIAKENTDFKYVI